MPPVSTTRRNQTPPAPPAASPEPARPILTPVAIEAPMTRLPGEPYCQRRIDLDLTMAEAQALRDLYDGLTIKGEFSGRNAVPKDAIRWLLNRYGGAFAKAGK